MMRTPDRPPWLRAANAAGRLIVKSGLYRADLDAERLLLDARRRTGLEDFGDGLSLDGLKLLLESCETDARLHFIGRIAAREDALQLLINRLRLTADRKRHPQIAEQAVRAPLIIVGLPRTGTTLLHRLLAQDPANRVPLTWEILHPSPPPEPATYETDPRIALAEREIKWLDRLAPGFERIHEVGARLPEECIAIMGHSFASYRFPAMYRIPRYLAWLDRSDLRAAFSDHRRILQHLQWRKPGRWVLKSPDHLFALPALLETYPDALIVQTHRDPLKVLASLASLTAALYGAFSDKVDLIEIGQVDPARWAEALRLSIVAREGAHAARFFDVHYHELVRDPIAAVRGIYARLGGELSGAAETAMRQFLAGHPQGRHGRHRYALEPFGLDAQTERRRYRFYQQRFGVPDE